MQVKLVMFKEDGERRDFTLPEGIATIGRGEECDLQIPLASVSRRHCQLVQEDEELRMRDLGSTNGTYHNEQRVQEAVLEAGDHVRVGPVIFTVVMNDQPAHIEPVRTFLEAVDQQQSPGKAPQVTAGTVDVEQHFHQPPGDSQAMGRQDLPDDFTAPNEGASEEDPLSALAALNRAAKKKPK